MKRKTFHMQKLNIYLSLSELVLLQPELLLRIQFDCLWVFHQFWPRHSWVCGQEAHKIQNFLIQFYGFENHSLCKYDEYDNINWKIVATAQRKRTAVTSGHSMHVVLQFPELWPFQPSGWKLVLIHPIHFQGDLLGTSLRWGSCTSPPTFEAKQKPWTCNSTHRNMVFQNRPHTKPVTLIPSSKFDVLSYEPRSLPCLSTKSQFPNNLLFNSQFTDQHSTYSVQPGIHLTGSWVPD